MKLGPKDIGAMVQRLVEYMSIKMLYLKRKAKGIREILMRKKRKVLFILQISLTQMRKKFIRRLY